MTERQGGAAVGRPLCGVRFCGGCNPRYDRGEAYREICRRLDGCLKFEHAVEAGSTGTKREYDLLLVIGGCGSCCASVEQYAVSGPVVRIWEWEQLEERIAELERLAGAGRASL